jgi:hypothetical protein
LTDIAFKTDYEPRAIIMKIGNKIFIWEAAMPVAVQKVDFKVHSFTSPPIERPVDDRQARIAVWVQVWSRS